MVDRIEPQIGVEVHLKPERRTGFPFLMLAGSVMVMMADWPGASAAVPLRASYSEEALRAWIADLAAQHDQPPQPADIVLETHSFQAGRPGAAMDQAAAFALLSEALHRPTERVVELPSTPQEAPPPDVAALQALIVSYLQAQQFRGVVSVYVVDEQTGAEMALDVDLRQAAPIYPSCDIAYAGLSTMKLTILTEYYRYLAWEPLPYEQETIDLAITKSSNLLANAMLTEIGYGDPYAGTRAVNATMANLGLENTFLVAPYDDETPPEYYSTPAREAARSGGCINTLPDPYMQTTPRDLALLLDMIYLCAESGGGLLAAYPEDITQDECQAMIDVLSRNMDGKLIRAGVPAGIQVAHKHGFGLSDTISDAGIVFSPGGDYVIVMFIWQETDWLNAYETFPIMRDISAATFNYFNPNLIYEERMQIEDMFDAGS